MPTCQTDTQFLKRDDTLVRMASWFTADLHFGHRNIVRYWGRPFDNVDAMDSALIDNWNEEVSPLDTVWVVGDFALGRTAETLPTAHQLHGHKVLVAGNHDRCWAGHRRRADGWTERYLDAGFHEVIQGSTTTEVEGTEVLVCHFPYRSDQAHDRFDEHRPVDEGAWLLHGHVHRRWVQQGRMMNVGVDVNGFRPVSAAKIAELIRSGPSSTASTQ